MKKTYTLATAIRDGNGARITSVTGHKSFREAADTAMKCIDKGSRAANELKRYVEGDPPASLSVEHGGISYRIDEHKNG